MDRYTQLMALLSTVLVGVLLIIVVSNQPTESEVQTSSSTTYVDPNHIVSQFVNINHNESEQVVEVLAD